MEAPLRPRLPGNDEVSSLDAQFHVMAGILEEVRSRERSLMQHSAAVICSLTADYTFSSVSAASKRLWGFDSFEITGSNVRNLMESSDFKAFVATLEQIKAKSEQNTIDVRMVTRLGALSWNCWTVRWLQAQSEYYCVVHDINQQKELDLLKREFIAMINHDLRAPLSSVTNFLELVVDGTYGKLNDKGIQRQLLVRNNVKRLLKLVNELLDMEQLESGKLRITTERFPVSYLVDRSIESCRALAEQGLLELRAEIDSDCDAIGDPDRLTQVLVNLISNAIKFSPAQNVVIVRVLHKDKMVLIEVEDKGCGIAEDQQAMIFSRFYQIERAGERARGGFGLGLAIARSIVELHGGHISVRSAIGAGSVFAFTIPVAEDEAIVAKSARQA